jgi:type IV secretory pathway VirB4 component
MAAMLRELPFRSRVFVSVHVPDQTKEIESLQTQRRIAYSMVAGKRGGVSDIESTAKFQDLETLLEQMIAQGQKVFHVAVNVLLQGDDALDLDTQVSQVLSKFREMGGAEAMQETLAAYDIFTDVAIPNTRCRERIKRIKTSNLADLLPLYGPWPGHKTPRVLLRSRMGSLLGFDFFDPSLANANQLLSGGSGSGKSALANILLLHMLK